MANELKQKKGDYTDVRNLAAEVVKMEQAAGREIKNNNALLKKITLEH